MAMGITITTTIKDITTTIITSILNISVGIYFFCGEEITTLHSTIDSNLNRQHMDHLRLSAVAGRQGDSIVQGLVFNILSSPDNKRLL